MEEETLLEIKRLNTGMHILRTLLKDYIRSRTYNE
jgi:hypothetical protein